MVRLICTAKTGAVGVITSESEFGAAPTQSGRKKTEFFDITIWQNINSNCVLHGRSYRVHA